MRSSIRTISALVAVVAWLSASTSWGTVVEASDQDREEARRAFAEGQRLYDGGRYDEAIERFREADRLVPSPWLQFNIAQAYRKKGSCREALAGYRRFLREVPDGRADLRSVAQQHVQELEPRCGSPASPGGPVAPLPPAPRDQQPAGGHPAPPPPAPSVAPPMPRAASLEAGARVPEPPPAGGVRRWLVPTFLVGGASLLLVAGGTLLWSEHQHDFWSEEDDRLRERKEQGVYTPQDIERQNANDARLREIHRLDAIALGTGIAGALLLLTGGGIVAFRGLSVGPAPRSGTAMSFSIAF